MHASTQQPQRNQRVTSGDMRPNQRSLPVHQRRMQTSPVRCCIALRLHCPYAATVLVLHESVHPLTDRPGRCRNWARHSMQYCLPAMWCNLYQAWRVPYTVIHPSSDILCYRSTSSKLLTKPPQVMTCAPTLYTRFLSLFPGS